MNQKAIFDNRKARVQREFIDGKHEGLTEPHTDEEFEAFFEYEQKEARKSIIARQYKWWYPDLTPPTSKHDVDGWFEARELGRAGERLAERTEAGEEISQEDKEAFNDRVRKFFETHGNSAWYKLLQAPADGTTII